MAVVRSRGQLQSSPQAGACCWTQQWAIEGPGLCSHNLAWAMYASRAQISQSAAVCSPVGFRCLHFRVPERPCNMLLWSYANKGDGAPLHKSSACAALQQPVSQSVDHPSQTCCCCNEKRAPLSRPAGAQTHIYISCLVHASTHFKVACIIVNMRGAQTPAALPAGQQCAQSEAEVCCPCLCCTPSLPMLTSHCTSGSLTFGSCLTEMICIQAGHR